LYYLNERSSCGTPQQEQVLSALSKYENKGFGRMINA
jgi:hypothetical protein